MIRRFHQQIRVNDFYKKGCQEKNSASTGGRDFSLEIQPTVVSQPWRSIGGCPFLVGVSPLLVAMSSSSKERQAGLALKGNHGSIGGSWPIAISGSPRG